MTAIHPFSPDIIGLCETWMRGSGQFKVHDDYKLLYTGATKAKYGVANKITLVKHVSERMMGLTIKLGDKHRIINVSWKPGEIPRRMGK